MGKECRHLRSDSLRMPELHRELSCDYHVYSHGKSCWRRFSHVLGARPAWGQSASVCFTPPTLLRSQRSLSGGSCLWKLSFGLLKRDLSWFPFLLAGFQASRLLLHVCLCFLLHMWVALLNCLNPLLYLPPQDGALFPQIRCPLSSSYKPSMAWRAPRPVILALHTIETQP